MQIKPMIVSVLSAGLVAIVGCSTPPSKELSQARQAYADMENSSISKTASVPLYEAKQDLEMAGATDDLKKQKHYAYMAQQKVKLANLLDQKADTESQVDMLQEKQQDYLMQKREREAEAAREEARNAQQQLHAYQTEERESELEAARTEAEEAQKQLAALRDEINAAKSRQTDSGVVLTLGDVVFAFDKAELKPGAERSLQRLSDFLKRHDQREVLIEGFTDTVGSEAYNMKLSRRRAESVARALKADGISASRITTRGLGEQYPVTSNDSAAGRQQNRRVEITILNPGSPSENAGRKNESA